MHSREELEGILIRLAVVAALAVQLTAPVAADWIVTRDGDRVETRGSWTIQGRLVVFEQPNGKLVSIALANVDLDASDKATLAALSPTIPPSPVEPIPQAEAVMVLTDADVAHAEPDVQGPAVDEGGAADGESAREAASRPKERLEITSWDRSSDSGITGTLITGRLANTSQEVATRIELVAKFFDHEAEAIASVPASVTATTLRPGQTASFRVQAEDVYSFTALRWDISSLGLETRADQEGPDPDQVEPDPDPEDAGR